MSAPLAAVADAALEEEASDDSLDHPQQQQQQQQDSDLELGSTSQQVRDQLGDLAKKHLTNGETAFERHQWDTAVQEFTAALKFAVGPQQEGALLVKRSAALVRFARHLLLIPACVSERRAVFAHDPSVLAQLALRDAGRAAKLRPTWPEAAAAEGRALVLLERHADAEAAFLEGLVLAPNHPSLKNDLQAVQELLAKQEQEQQELLADVRKASMDSGGALAAAAAAAAAAEQPAGGSGEAAAAGGSGSSPARRVRSVSLEGAASGGLGAAGPAAAGAPKRQRRVLAVGDADDCDCILCMKLLLQPVTTPCGHTFCKGCFARSMDHSNRCPMCRTVLHVGRELPVTIILETILSKAFPAEHAARAAEAAVETATAAEAAAGRVTLPLFVMSTLLPGEKMALNVFEPRYRLMVRRCMEGNRRFGMAQTGRSGPDGLDQLAVEAEILECSPLPDGRYYLELVGVRRLRITQCWDLDGYRVASADVLVDAPDAPAAAAAAPAGDNAVADAGEEGAAGGAAAPPASAAELAAQVLESCDALVARVRGVLASRRVGAASIREFFDRVGDKPGAADSPEAVSWWAARLLLLLVPSNTEGWLRRELMEQTSTAARLRSLQERLMALAASEGVGGAGCVIM